ncbi:hypothetical protein LY76DRAFT_225997 [Colletotrichum caudatum]|nr:hypothetical protein LY76DRAFT_225997 [Colletotrichum caudatum]
MPPSQPPKWDQFKVLVLSDFHKRIADSSVAPGTTSSSWLTDSPYSLPASSSDVAFPSSRTRTRSGASTPRSGILLLNPSYTMSWATRMPLILASTTSICPGAWSRRAVNGGLSFFVFYSHRAELEPRT